MAGIKETKDLLDFMATLGNATGVVLQDGRFQWMELVNYVGALTKLPAAAEGIEQVPAELQDLDEAEIAELKAFFADKLELPQADIEIAIEDHLAVALPFYRLVQKYWLKRQ